MRADPANLACQAEALAREEIRRVGPLEAFTRLIGENDLLIRSPALDNGRWIAAQRTAIHAELMRHWAEEQCRRFGYGKPFALVALGGTGRAEMTPFSDSDFAYLFDDVLEGNEFLLELQRQTLHTDQFQAGYGFRCEAMPFNMDDVLRLSDKQLNSFLDLRPISDPQGLAGPFRERVRATYDPFEHFLHVRSFWQREWERAAGEWEQLNEFDIKNDALRVFLAGVWTLAGKEFIHSHDVYRALEDPRDLEAYDFLLRVRAFVHSRKSPGRRLGGGRHVEDVLEFADFTSFGELLGPEADDQARFEFANRVRARLISARRRVARFTRGVIQRELTEGRPVSQGSHILYGVSGLRHTRSGQCATPQEKSQAALSLLLASQRYDLPIDPTELQNTFRDAGDWLVRAPELSALFYEPRGSLADSFRFLSQFDGAEDRLFPGYAQFEASMDARVMKEQKSLRGALERKKVQFLEDYVKEGRALLAGAVCPEKKTRNLDDISIPVEAALLDSDHLAAVKLALKTKRLPLTPDDLEVRRNTRRPLHERFSSGTSEVPLADYYEPYRTECDFTTETVRAAEFLVANRRAFKQRADAGPNDAKQVGEFVKLCGTEDLLRALFVFTCADRAEWESEKDDAARWFNTRELYAKAMACFRPALQTTAPPDTAGYSERALDILRDFGQDFFGGVYRRYADRFCSHVVRLADEPDLTAPKASVLRDGMSVIVGVAARDFRGLAACISGAFWHESVSLRQAHLFSAMNHGLALDFFHVSADSPAPPGFIKRLEEAIQRRLYIGDEDEASLPRISGVASLLEWRPGQYCLRMETAQVADGLVYLVAYRVFRHLRGNIFGLTSRSAHGSGAYVSVYHSLPPDLTFQAARAIVAERF